MSCVITSYSIHYTKLYDFAFGGRALLLDLFRGDGGGGVSPARPDEGEHIGDLLIGEIILPRLHDTVELRTPALDGTVEPMQDDVV